MALTPVAIDPKTVVPKDIRYLALSAGAGQGFSFTISTADGSSTSPKVVRIVGDADWFWSFQDSQAVATTAMVRVRADQPERVQVGPQGLTLYCNVASGTSNLMVVLEY